MTTLNRVVEADNMSFSSIDLSEEEAKVGEQGSPDKEGGANSQFAVREEAEDDEDEDYWRYNIQTHSI